MTYINENNWYGGNIVSNEQYNKTLNDIEKTGKINIESIEDSLEHPKIIGNPHKTKALDIEINSISGITSNNVQEALDEIIGITNSTFRPIAEDISINPISGMTSDNTQEALNEIYNNTIRLETNLNIKNAEQDASIKSIEQLLSQSNMNQTAQVSSSGRENISLPKTASNGGMEVKLEGLTAQNLVVNGDFRNGTTGWALAFIANVATNSDITFTATAKFGMIFQRKKSTAGNKYYICGKVKSDSSLVRLKYTDVISSDITATHSGSGNYERLSKIGTILNTSAEANFRVVDERESGWTPISAKELFYVDLTTTFGAGNEPDLATCDAMFSTYFEGTKSFIPIGRVRSVGKNLFDKKLIATPDKFTITIDGSYKSVPVKLKPNTTYTMKVYAINSYNFVGKNIYFGIKGVGEKKDAIHSTIGLPTATVTSRPDGVVEIFLNFGTTQETQSRINTILENANIQLEQNSIATTYEPYKSTKLYLTAQELKSNGLVRDEVRKGANGYELVKRVGVGTLGVNGIVGGDFENGLVGAIGLGEEIATWSLNNSSPISGTQDGRLIVSSAGTSNVRPLLLFNNNRTAGQLRRFSCSYKINSGTISPIQFHKGSSSLFIPFVGTSGSMAAYYICEGTLANYLYFNGKNTFDLQLDNIKDELVNVSDGLPSNSTTTEFGTDIYYSLATPVITPIEHAGILNSAESGTVYHEPVVADAAIYGTNISILNTTYPISSLEEIMVHTNVDIYLDVSKAVISGDGLSFTHPDLRAGDLVLFTYFFNKEKVNGLITATYYDGRYVIADTSNGKFYKWGVKSTNGVATINLTEV